MWITALWLLQSNRRPADRDGIEVFPNNRFYLQICPLSSPFIRTYSAGSEGSDAKQRCVPSPHHDLFLYYTFKLANMACMHNSTPESRAQSLNWTQDKAYFLIKQKVFKGLTRVPMQGVGALTPFFKYTHNEGIRKVPNRAHHFTAKLAWLKSSCYPARAFNPTSKFQPICLNPSNFAVLRV